MGTTFSATARSSRPAVSPRHRIFFGLIGERKNVGRKEDRRSGLRVARRLRETIVEAAAARSGDVREDAVERDPAIFVGVESLVEKVAQEASVLRNAFAVDALQQE